MDPIEWFFIGLLTGVLSFYFAILPYILEYILYQSIKLLIQSKEFICDDVTYTIEIKRETPNE